MDILLYVAIAVGAYLIGSISPALIISNSIEKKDVRDYGSGNAGTTNMVRTFGWKHGLVTFVLDIAKGALCALLGRVIGGDLGLMIGGITVILGHNFPIYYGFKGGKGIAATVGVLLVAVCIQTLIILVPILLLILLTGIVSIGSLVGVLLEAIAVFIFYPGQPFVQATVVGLAVLAFIGHRGNIVRLLNGTENKLSIKTKKQA